MQKEEIKKQVKELLDKFSHSLDLLIEKKSEKAFEGIFWNIEREKQEREEENSDIETDSEFRKIMFQNAPVSNENFIFGEKKKWE